MKQSGFSFKRKLIFLVFSLLCFTLTTSFTTVVKSEEELLAEQLAALPEDAILFDEEVDMTTFSANEEDLKALASKSVSSNNATLVTTATVDDGTKVYDEVYGYVDATFEDDWSLILVNKEHLIPEDYEFELGTIRGNIKSDMRIVDLVLSMIRSAREDGIVLSICSPYRDYDRQVMLFNRKVKSYIRAGYSQDEAYELAAETVAIPGTSEHQIGLAFDFISNDYTTLDAGFAETAAGRWLKANAADYGFILRYPKDKTEITGIEFEPWHYRYVGTNASHEIMDNGLCLEEYLQQIGMLE